MPAGEPGGVVCPIYRPSWPTTASFGACCLARRLASPCHGIRDLSALDDEACVVNGDARDAVVIHRPRVDHNLFARLARVPLASSSAKCRASIPGVST